MAFKLTKAQFTERGAIVSRLEYQAERLRSAITNANDVLEQAAATVNAEIEAYNQVLAEAGQFANAVAHEAQEEISEKSERWQESPRGEAASNWATEWEEADLSELELVSIDPVDEAELDHAVVLANLPGAVGEGEE